MATHDVVLHPSSVVAELRKNNTTHVVWLPDSETNFMYQLLTDEPSLDLVPVCREWEGMGKSAGYAATFAFDNLEDLTNGIDEVLETRGPVFVHLTVTPEIEHPPVQFRNRPPRTIQNAIRELPEALGIR